MITTCSPSGYFSIVVFQSRDTFSHCFFPLSVNNSLAQDLRPLPWPRQLCLQPAWCLQSSKVQLQQLSKKVTAKPSPPPPDSFSPNSSKETS